MYACLYPCGNTSSTMHMHRNCIPHELIFILNCVCYSYFFCWPYSSVFLISWKYSLGEHTVLYESYLLYFGPLNRFHHFSCSSCHESVHLGNSLFHCQGFISLTSFHAFTKSHINKTFSLILIWRDSDSAILDICAAVACANFLGDCLIRSWLKTHNTPIGSGFVSNLGAQATRFFPTCTPAWLPETVTQLKPVV